MTVEGTNTVAKRRHRTAVALVAFVLSLSLFSDAASASTATASFTQWPWSTAQSTQIGVPVGAMCQLRVWSYDGSGAYDSWAWSNSLNGVISYTCEAVDQIGVQMATAPAIAFCVVVTCQAPEVPVKDPGGFSGSWAATVGQQQASPGIALVTANYNNLNAKWYRITGRIVYKASCQPGGSGSSGSCFGFSPPSGSGVSGLGANPTAASICPYTAGPFTTGSAGSTAYLRMGTTNLKTACVIEAGTGPVSGSVSVMPDGSSPPAQAGNCSIDSPMFATWQTASTGDHAIGDPVALDTKGTFSTFDSSQRILIEFDVINVSGVVGAYIKLNDLYDNANSTYRAIPYNAAGQSYTISVPRASTYSISVGCTVNGVAHYVLFYAGGGDPDAQYEGDPNGVPDGQDCATNSFCIGDQTGSNGAGWSALADCWDSVWSSFTLLGVTIPYPNPIHIAGGVICSIQVIFVPTPEDIDELGRLASNVWTGSPLDVVQDVFVAPFDLWGAFSANASSGDCAGPTVDVDIGMTADKAPTHYQPLNACSGNGAQISGLVRNGLAITTYIGAAYFAFAVIATAAGIHPVSFAASADGRGKGEATDAWIQGKIDL